MKKFIVLVYLILFFKLSFSQTDCQKGKENAKNDFKNSIFVLHSKDILPNEMALCYVLKTNYSISMHITDSLDLYECYNLEMNELLKGKYGADFFEKAKTIADSLENSKNWKKDAEFPGGAAEMHKFITKRLSLAYIKKGGANKRLLIQTEIDVTGKAINPHILQGVNNELDRNAIYIINQMPKWEPAYMNGNPIKQTVIIPIDIDYK